MTGWQNSFSMLKYYLLFLGLIHNLMFQLVFICNKQTWKANTPKEKEDALCLGGFPLKSLPSTSQLNHLAGLFFNSGTFMPSPSLIQRKEICVYARHRNLYDQNAWAKTEQLKSTLLWSEKLGRKEPTSYLNPEKCFLDSLFCLHLRVGKSGLWKWQFCPYNPTSMPWPLRSLWKFCRRKDIPAQKLPTITSDPATIVRALARGTSDVAGQGEWLCGQVTKCRLNPWFPSLYQCTFLK